MRFVDPTKPYRKSGGMGHPRIGCAFRRLTSSSLSMALSRSHPTYVPGSVHLLDRRSTKIKVFISDGPSEITSPLESSAGLLFWSSASNSPSFLPFRNVPQALPRSSMKYTLFCSPSREILAWQRETSLGTRETMP